MSRRVAITATSTSPNPVLTLLAAIDADNLSATLELFSADEALITVRTRDGQPHFFRAGTLERAAAAAVRDLLTG